MLVLSRIAFKLVIAVTNPLGGVYHPKKKGLKNLHKQKNRVQPSLHPDHHPSLDLFHIMAEASLKDRPEFDLGTHLRITASMESQTTS